MEKQERLLALAQKASGLAVQLKALNDWQVKCQRHCHLLHFGSAVLQKNRVKYTEKQINKANEVVKNLDSYQKDCQNICEKLNLEEKRLKEIPLHTALISEDKKTIGDVFSLLPIHESVDQLTETLGNIRSKADTIQRNMQEIQGNPVSGMSYNPGQTGLEAEIQSAERIVSAYLTFRSALEARRPLEGGLPPIDQFYSIVSQLEALRPALDRLREETKSDCHLAFQTFQDSLRCNVSAAKSIKTLIKGPLKLLEKLIRRATDLMEFLRQCGGMQEAYEACLGEITRRREFAVRTLEKRRELIAEIEAETRLRESFCSHFGAILPLSFLPQLRQSPSYHLLSNPATDPDFSLPAINQEIAFPSPDPHLTSNKEIQDLKTTFETLKTENNRLKSELESLEIELITANKRVLDTENSLSREIAVKTTLQTDLEKHKEYSHFLSCDLQNLRKIIENFEIETTLQSKEIKELKAKLACAMQESSLLESVKIQADASSAELKEKIEHLRVNNYKLRKKLKTTIHFNEFMEGGLALFFPCNGGFAAFHMGAEPVFLHPDVLKKKPELR